MRTPSGRVRGAAAPRTSTHAAHAVVAHKTGEISTACHDMGIVYLPEREPYLAVILTEFDSDRDGRRETVAAISEAIYRSVMGT